MATLNNHCKLLLFVLTITIYTSYNQVIAAPIALVKNVNLDAVLSNVLFAFDTRTTERVITINNETPNTLLINCRDQHFEFGKQQIAPSQVYTMRFDRHSFDGITHFWCTAKPRPLDDNSVNDAIKEIRFASFGENAPRLNNEFVIKQDIISGALMVMIRDDTKGSLIRFASTVA